MIKINPTYKQIDHIVATYSFKVEFIGSAEHYNNSKDNFVMKITPDNFLCKSVHINDNLYQALKGDPIYRKLIK